MKVAPFARAHGFSPGSFTNFLNGNWGVREIGVAAEMIDTLKTEGVFVSHEEAVAALSERERIAS